MLRIIKVLAIATAAVSLAVLPVFSASAATGPTSSPCSASHCTPPRPPASPLDAPTAPPSNEGTQQQDSIAEDNALTGGGDVVYPNYGYPREPKMVTVKLSTLESLAETNNQLRTTVIFLSIFLAIAVLCLVGALVAPNRLRK